MQRHSVTAEIFGYLICLLAVFIFFASAAGVVSNAFRVVHPTPVHPLLAGAMAARFARHPWMGEQPMASPPQGMAPGAQPGMLRDRIVAGARFDAIRRFVVSVVMLVLAILVFRRAFEWLNPRQAVT